MVSPDEVALEIAIAVKTAEANRFAFMITYLMGPVGFSSPAWRPGATLTVSSSSWGLVVGHGAGTE